MLNACVCSIRGYNINTTSFAMECVKICPFKTFRAKNFALKNLFCFFLEHVKKFVCEDISAEYKFRSEKYEGGFDRLKIK